MLSRVELERSHERQIVALSQGRLWEFLQEVGVSQRGKANVVAFRNSTINPATMAATGWFSTRSYERSIFFGDQSKIKRNDNLSEERLREFSRVAIERYLSSHG